MELKTHLHVAMNTQRQVTQHNTANSPEIDYLYTMTDFWKRRKGNVIRWGKKSIQ